MAIQPGLQLPFGLQAVNPLHVDSYYGPYSSVAEANLSVPIVLRTVNNGASVMGRTVGIIISGTQAEYWWDGGVADVNLVIKSGGGGGGFVNPMTTIGDVIVGGSSGTPTRLGIGLLKQVLTTTGSVPSWSYVTELYDGFSSFSLNSTILSLSVPTFGNVLNLRRGFISFSDGSIDSVISGPSGNASAGNIRLIGGNVIASSGIAGDVNIQGGGTGGSAVNVTSGNVNIFSGTPSGTGNEGSVSVQTRVAGKLGFFAATPVIKQAAVTTVQGIADVLTAYGLLPTSVISGGGGGGTFLADITVSLSGGKTVGKYTNGQTIPSTGLTAEQVLNLIAIEYISPVFTSFNISGQPTTVEVGTTISGSKTFTWSININSGVVATIDVFDITGGVNLLTNTPNDGSEAVSVGSYVLNTSGAQRSYRGIGHDTGSSPSNFNSGTFTITSLFLRFFGPSVTSPATSGAVRSLPSSAFQTGGATFILNTGNTQTKFVVALPPGVTISTVFDIDALGANITANYVLIGTVNVLDAGGTNRAYNVYELNLGSPYSANHQHSITTS